MPSPYLSKSDFKACFDCRTKLFYRKNSYPTNLDENEYLQFLADGGFMIEVIAKAKYPRGIDLADERDQVAAFKRTQELINAKDDAVVFEAAAISEKYLARIDILRREGNTLHLIEVKSSSIKGNEKDNEASSPFVGVRDPTKVSSKWKPYLLDVAFQTHVLRQAFPAFKVIPWLCVVDKSHRVTSSETIDKFSLSRDESNPNARPEVTYSGSLKNLKDSKLVIEREVTKETYLLNEEVKSRASELAASMQGKSGKVTRLKESVSELYKTCRKCEYRFKPETAPDLHGFAECWGDLANAKPHILDLHRVTQIGTTKFPDPVPALLANGSASLLDLTVDELGKEGTWQMRRQIQWSHSSPPGTEYLPNTLQSELSTHQTDPGWPLHFVDFEACNVALPHHAGLRPYERVAFQWSCHSLDQKGNLAHAEWLNTERDLPNFAFAQSLRQHIGDTGTIYVWSPYEESTLKGVLKQIEEWVKRDSGEAQRISKLKTRAELDSLADWINGLLGHEDAKGKRHNPPRIRDLHKLALEHYFHPEMLGRTSIKVVLPAVWRHNTALGSHPWFIKYLALDDQGQPKDPYKTLPDLPLGEDDGDDEAIVEGTGAIRVYQDLIFRQDTDPEFRLNRELLLKQYCELDTAAMVMIWKHWVGY